MEVAALYICTSGPYWQREGVDAWDIDRDARSYTGELPVVAHPPCQLWTNFAHLNYKRWGGEHNRPGNDGGCFAHALESVRRCGGVLEHPAFSHAFKEFGLGRPVQGRWSRAPDGKGWVAQVAQSAYGHPARKLTWLYYVGEQEPLAVREEAPEGSHQVGWFDRKKPTLSKKEAIRTPPAFAEFLLALARHSRG